MVVVSRCARAGRGGVGRQTTRLQRESASAQARQDTPAIQSGLANLAWCPLKFIPMNSAARPYRPIAKINFPNRNRLSNAQRPSLSPHRMRGEGGFSRVRGVPTYDIDWKLLLAATLNAELQAAGVMSQVRGGRVRSFFATTLARHWIGTGQAERGREGQKKGGAWYTHGLFNTNPRRPLPREGQLTQASLLPGPRPGKHCEPTIGALVFSAFPG